MKQLDRIEYNQIREHIDKRFYFVTSTFFYTLFWMIMAFAVLGTLFYVHFDSLDIFIAVGTLMKVLWYGLMITIILDAITIFRKSKAIKFVDNKFLKGG